jgi:hypothetical protein
MSPTSTITLVVPRAEKESLFLLHVVQIAIRAYRNERPRSLEENPDTVKDDQLTDTHLAA